MRLSGFFLSFACVAILLTALPVHAENPQADVPGWIKQLDSSKFSERELASRKLAEAGQSALEEVAKAVASESREVSTRAFQILRDWNAGGSADLKAQAKAALEKLSKSDNKKIARQADMSLNPPADRQAQAVPGLRPRIQVFPVPGGGIQGNIQIQVRGIQIAGGKGGRKIQFQNNNGVRKIDVTEGDKKIRIEDDPKKGIQIQVTEKINGKETTKKYQAKDKDELKKKHPEIRKLYDKYSGNQAGGFQFRARAVPALPGRIQQAIPLQKLLPGLPVQPQKARAANPKAANAVAEAQKELQAVLEQLKKATEKEQPALPEILKRIEAAAKRLAEAQQNLAE